LTQEEGLMAEKVREQEEVGSDAKRRSRFWKKESSIISRIDWSSGRIVLQKRRLIQPIQDQVLMKYRNRANKNMIVI